MLPKVPSRGQVRCQAADPSCPAVQLSSSPAAVPQQQPAPEQQAVSEGAALILEAINQEFKHENILIVILNFGPGVKQYYLMDRAHVSDSSWIQ